jgi:hypothetical protein
MKYSPFFSTPCHFPKKIYPPPPNPRDNPASVLKQEGALMDWAMVIERNSERLFVVVASLVAMVRVRGGGMAACLPRHVYSAALILLRPAESAVRRLIIIAARGLVVKLKLSAARAFPAGLCIKSNPERVPAFCLIDPLKRFAPEDFAPEDLERGKTKVQVLPRISVPGLFDPVFTQQPLPTDGIVASAALGRRVQALRHALDNLPREARRLARWKARGELRRQSEVKRKPGRLSPFRPGFAPGYHRSRPQEVDEILSECHHFAVEAWHGPDTS